MESITRELYRILQACHPQEEDANKTRAFALDWLGCLAAGRQTEQGKILQTWSRKWAGTDLEQQVFLMAALSHITETDDLHRGSVTHPACVAFPAAWHLCRRLKKPLGDFLTASLHGYEVMCRIGEAVGPEHYKIFHNTATAGVFGSAAASAKLLDLSEDPFVWALGNAGTQAAGLWQFNEDATMSKHLHAGQAAAAGLKAALLAAEGFTGPAQILEGKKGFFAGLCPNPKPDAVTTTSDGWKLAETSIKPYPSCRHTHPAIDASLNIREELKSNGIEPNQIESVKVSTYETALRVTDNPAPESTYAAKFSLQYCVALALKIGFPGLHHFEGQLLENMLNSDLLQKTKLSVGSSYDEAYPKHWGAVLTIHAGGKTFKSDVTSAKGDPENPLSEKELLQKFYELMEYGCVKKTLARRLASWILEADENELIPDLDLKNHRTE